MKKLIIAFIGLSFIACSESAQDLIDTRKADAEEKFEQFYACYEMAKELPPISEDKVNWEEEDINPKYRESNAHHISMPSFADLSQPLEIPFDGMRRRESADMANLFNIDLSDHKEPHSFEVDPKYSYHKPESGESCVEAINHFLNTKYLLISRNYTEQGAIATGMDSFQGGYVFGEVLVFDCIQGKYLGGYRFDAKSQNSVSVGSSGDVDANIRADLESNVRGAIEWGLKEHAPWLNGVSFYLS